MLKIKRDIDRVSQQLILNPKIQGCTEGRDLSQITGGTRGAENRTTARFPRLLDQSLDMIIMSGLTTADNNYRKQLAKMRDEAETSIIEKITATVVQVGEVCWRK